MAPCPAARTRAPTSRTPPTSIESGHVIGRFDQSNDQRTQYLTQDYALAYRRTGEAKQRAFSTEARFTRGGRHDPNDDVRQRRSGQRRDERPGRSRPSTISRTCRCRRGACRPTTPSRSAENPAPSSSPDSRSSSVGPTTISPPRPRLGVRCVSTAGRSWNGIRLPRADQRGVRAPDAADRQAPSAGGTARGAGDDGALARRHARRRSIRESLSERDFIVRRDSDTSGEDQLLTTDYATRSVSARSGGVSRRRDARFSVAMRSCGPNTPTRSRWDYRRRADGDRFS